MPLKQVESILKAPHRLLGVGPRALTERKVSKLWPACLLTLGLLVSSLGITPSAQAHELQTSSFSSDSVSTSKRVFQLYYEDLGAFVSAPAETKEGFMLRVGSFLAHYTLKTGWEACGMVQESIEGKAWTVRLVTNGSQMGCARVAFEQDGFVPLDESIHSHPAGPRLTATAQDQRLHPNLSCGERYTVSSHVFSARDFSLGAGYLVIPAKLFSSAQLLHQTNGKASKVGKLSENIARPDIAYAGKPLSQEGVVLVPLSKAAEVVPPPLRRCRNF